jgi:hypothetical protein
MGAPKPLFIPLKREHFEAFLAGDKTIEYRRHGRGWNRRTCWSGRLAIVSLGYSGARLERVVKNTWLLTAPEVPPSVRKIYPDAKEIMAIELVEV